MGAVLHLRICKGCLVRHSHGHSHMLGFGGGHSHDEPAGHLPRSPRRGSSDDQLIHGSISNGYSALPTENGSDVQLLIDEGDDRQPAAAAATPPAHRSTNVNIRAAMVHVIGDLIQSIGVFTAAVIVLVKV